MTTLVDTGVLAGAANERDSLHADALRVVAQLEDEDVVTTDHVLIECWALLRRRAGYAKAMRFWQGLRSSGIRTEFVQPADFERALSIAERWSDQTFSMVDCTSFAVMERLGITRAAAFDRDFAVYRYGPDGTRAFEIIR